MLANNVTQAQAFCIATACLQVPVLFNKRPHPVLSLLGPPSLANNLLERTTSKLNLYRSYLHNIGPSIQRLFSTNSNNNKRTYSDLYGASKLAYPMKAQHRYKRELFFEDDSAKIDDLLGNLNYSLMADNLSTNAANHSTYYNSQFDEPPLTAAMDTKDNNATNGMQSSKQVTVIVDEGLPREYPNFNQMHARIRTGVHLPNRPPLMSSASQFWWPQRANSMHLNHGYGGLRRHLMSPRRFISLDHTHDYIRSAALGRLAELISATSDKLAWKRQGLAELLSSVTRQNHNRLAQMQRQVADTIISYPYRYYDPFRAPDGRHLAYRGRLLR